MKIFYTYAALMAILLSYLSGFNTGMARGEQVALQYNPNCKH